MLKLNLGCGPLPIHPQHLEVMKNPEEWTLVDLYVKDKNIKNWDATVLQEVKDETCDHIYASHLLEHISHRQVPTVLNTWYRKLKPAGKLTINVPDLLWASRQVIRHENGQMVDSTVFGGFEGTRGLQSIFYGTHDHEGEYHKAGFTPTSLGELLVVAGFHNININCWYDAHDMGVLLATAEKAV